MKKITTIFLLLFAIIEVNKAQFQITNSFMPNVGDTIVYKNIALSTTDYSPTGANYIWDFSDLVSETWLADTFVSVISTPITYNFYFNNPILYPNYVATAASPQSSITIPGAPISLTDVYSYYKKTSNSYSQVGIAASISGAPLASKFDNIDVIYKFPTSFGSEDSCYSSYKITVPTLGFYSKKQMRHNYCDGWGTLYSPTDTFSVVRIKTIITGIDSVYVNQLSMGFAQNSVTTEYKWFAQNYRNPVFYVTQTDIALGQSIKSVKYHSKPKSINTGIQDNSENPISIYPTLFHDNININLGDEIKNYSIKIFSVDGKNVYNKTFFANEKLITINLSNLSNGFYNVLINNGKIINHIPIIKN